MGSPKTGRSWWRDLIECHPLEKGMTNHFSILALKTPLTVWKGKKIWHQKMSLPRLIDVLYVTGEELRKSSRKNEEAGSQWKGGPVVDVPGGESEVQCCKEQYCIWNWNGGSMNQGKLEVVKQEMGKVNINILGIRELKWMGVGKFNSLQPHGL